MLAARLSPVVVEGCRGAEPRRKRLEMGFHPKVFLSLFYIMYEYLGSVLKPSLSRQVTETVLISCKFIISYVASI